MREWLAIISEPATALIDAIALFVILVGTVEVVFTVVRAAFKPLGEQIARRAWMRYARWLVAGLTFQLAADIIETSVSTSWQTIGRVAAVAVIRTFLNYFLERDVERQQQQCAAVPPQLPSRPEGP
ncbi:MAG TPA: DUF1622 domain-containing protein [Steroidobacteraceae bacterium]